MSITAIIDAGGEIVLTLDSAQGLAGAPGAPGPAAGEGAVYTTAAALSGHRAIAVDAAGEAIYASCDSLSDALRIAGVSLNAAALGDEITVQSAGLVEHSGWAWTPGQPVFVGIGGALTQSLPVGAVFSRVVGQAVSATRLLVDLQPPIVLI